MSAGDRPARWLVVELPVRDALRYELSAALIARGLSAVQETGTGVRVYLPGDERPVARIRELLDALEQDVPDLDDADFEWRVEDDADWSTQWREGLRARRVGERVWVAPSWSPADAEPDHIVVTVDPAMAFGTGEHGTTRGCIRLLERSGAHGLRVLDVGTGTGVLAVVAARLGAREVLAVDNDVEATDNAVETVASNGVADRVRVEQVEVDAGWLRASGSHDLILANVLSGVLRPLMPAFADALTRPGRLILSGILATEADDMRAAAEAAGFRLLEEDREAEWWSALLTID